jgi:hypothetical protein
MQSLIQTMVDQLGAMERVVRTPLPPLFGIHLKQSVSLYLFSLPLVLVDDMGWLMIAVVSLGAFDHSSPLSTRLKGLRADRAFLFGFISRVYPHGSRRHRSRGSSSSSLPPLSFPTSFPIFSLQIIELTDLIHFPLSCSALPGREPLRRRSQRPPPRSRDGRTSRRG